VVIRNGCKLPSQSETSEEKKRDRSPSQSSEDDSKYVSIANALYVDIQTFIRIKIASENLQG